MRMVAVVLGGGVGQRLGAGMPKQLLTLGGRTLIERCVAAFDQAPGIDEILVVMARGYTGQVEALLAGAGYRKVTAVIEGGVTRPDSTRAALAAIAARGPADRGRLTADRAPGRVTAACCCTTRPGRWWTSGSSRTAWPRSRCTTRPGSRCPPRTPW